MAPGKIEEFHDSDSDSDDVEFEDVLPTTHSATTHSAREEITDIPLILRPQPWEPDLSLPPQREQPVLPGSEEETQLRGQISTGAERVAYRKMKSDMGMDTPNTPPTHRKYDNFPRLAADVNGLVDTLWACATPAIQIEALISLAGLTQSSLPSFPFSIRATLSIFHKFDSIFAALCTGEHPITGNALPGAVLGQSLVTETQKVRIRSLAERTRYRVFSCFSNSSTSVGDGEGDEEEPEQELDEPLMLEATKIYEKTLMLLGEQSNVTEDEFMC